MADLIDSYSESEQNASYYMAAVHPGIYYGSGASSIGQSFKPATAKKITQAKFYLKKIGSPTGILRAKLYVHGGTFGSNSTPATFFFNEEKVLATSNDVDIASLSTDWALVDFNFPINQQYRMDGQDLFDYAQYVINCEIISGNFNSTNDYVDMGFHTYPNATHEGNMNFWPYGVPDVWYGISIWDCCFYVYGEDYSESESPDILIGRPAWDDTTNWGSTWINLLVTNAADTSSLLKLKTRQINGPNAIQSNYISGADMGATYITAQGHGSSSVFAGHNNAVIFETNDSEMLI